MVKKVMLTPVTLTLRELLGSAPDVLKQIHDYMKLTRPKLDHAFYANLPIPSPYYQEMQDTDSHYDTESKSQGYVNQISSGTIAAVTPNDKSLAFHHQDARLICIKMRFSNGLTVNAVIDSGSELDIVKDSIYEQTGLPIDMTESTMMNDINQNKKVLQGRLHNVKLTTGTLVTTTGLWVAPLPFALLLGRVWARQNRISIDERESGTWLCRCGPDDKKIWELCAIPSRHAHEFFEDNPSFFIGNPQSSTEIDQYLTSEYYGAVQQSSTDSEDEE